MGWGSRIVSQSFFVILITLVPYEGCLAAQAQSEPAPPILKEAQIQHPEDAYKQAMAPLEMVRKNLDNWSDAELNALTKVMRKAKESCEQLSPNALSGEDLYQLERLCGLGQDWKNTEAAASKYLRSSDPVHRAHSYAMRIDSLLHLGAQPEAITTARTMLHDLPYDAVVAQTFWFLIVRLATNFDPQAEMLAKEQHPFLLDALKKGVPLTEAHGDATVAMGALYQNGMQLPFLQRYNGKDLEASQSFRELEESLKGIQLRDIEDKQLIQKTKAQYNLLGKPLPAISLTASLSAINTKPKINQENGAAVTLVLFPEWCVQCVKMMEPLTQFAFRNGNAQLNAYGLMVPNKLPEEAEQARRDRFKDFRGTPTFLTKEDTLELFGAIDYPLGVITDRKGIVRFIGTIPSDAFNPDGYIERTLERILETSSAQEHKAL